MTPTGFVATFSQPFNPNELNLYGAQSSGDLPANVALSGNLEGPVRGSLVINATDTQVTFVATTLASSTGLPVGAVSTPNATSGVLAPDDYAVILNSGSTAFETANGQLLDGNDSGAGGTNYTAVPGGEQLRRRVGGRALLRPRSEQLDDHQRGQRGQPRHADLRAGLQQDDRRRRRAGGQGVGQHGDHHHHRGPRAVGGRAGHHRRFQRLVHRLQRHLYDRQRARPPPPSPTPTRPPAWAIPAAARRSAKDCTRRATR